jgi:hypothetical protein
LFRLALRDEMAASLASARPEIDHEIRAANRIFIVLDDENGVTEIPKLFERAEQAIVVARVQAYGRLV